MNLKINLSQEGVDNLKKFSSEIIHLSEDIQKSIRDLSNTYDGVSSELPAFDRYIREMLEETKCVSQKISDPLESLSQAANVLANKIEERLSHI